MKNMRNLFCVLMALMLAAFALPGMAAPQNKHFSLTMVTGNPDNTQQNSIVTATIANDNPSGSSAQFSSFILSVLNVSGITIDTADADSTFLGTVTVSADHKSVSVTDIPPVKANQSYVLTLHIKGCGDGNTWSATVWAGTNFSGGTYSDDHKGPETTDVPCGALACNDPVLVSGIVTSGQRGFYNKDGSTCSTVEYFVTDLIGTPSGLHFRWDTQLNAAFLYFLSEPVTQTAWLTDGTGLPIFVPALGCDLSSIAPLPAPYGTLLQDNGNKTIKVDSTTAIPGMYPLPLDTLAGAGFPIVIETERMQVTKISGQTWTVTRGTGNTSAKKHPAGKFVMSTPLPIIPNSLPFTNSVGVNGYAPGNFAHVCYPGTDSSSGIIDIGDAYHAP
jgi:hypothetical protein